MDAWRKYLAHGVFEPAFRPASVETIAQFNENMYPKGVNADFMAEDASKATDIVCCFKGTVIICTFYFTLLL
jgi:hypothetical protein